MPATANCGDGRCDWLSLLTSWPERGDESDNRRPSMWPQSRYRGRQRVYLQAMRSPPHIYTKVACTAKRNFDHECKKTFATKSVRTGLMHRSKRCVWITLTYSMT